MPTFEVVSVALGKTSIWTVEAKSSVEARRVAREKLRESFSGPGASIVSVRPQGYKPKRD